jgi:hypothetical protein
MNPSRSSCSTHLSYFFLQKVRHPTSYWHIHRALSFKKPDGKTVLPIRFVVSIPVDRIVEALKKSSHATVVYHTTKEIKKRNAGKKRKTGRLSGIRMLISRAPRSRCIHIVYFPLLSASFPCISLLPSFFI